MHSCAFFGKRVSNEIPRGQLRAGLLSIVAHRDLLDKPP